MSGWLVAALATGAAVWGWARESPEPRAELESAPAPASHAPDAATPAVAGDEVPLRAQIAALRACVTNLARCQQARDATRPPPSEATGPAPAVLAEPGLQAHVRGAGQGRGGAGGNPKLSARLTPGASLWPARQRDVPNRPSGAPASRCRWIWNTVCPPWSLQFITIR